MGVRIASICIRKDARALGETEQKLYVLDASEEAPVYSERERASLRHGRGCSWLIVSRSSGGRSQLSM